MSIALLCQLDVPLYTSQLSGIIFDIELALRPPDNPKSRSNGRPHFGSSMCDCPCNYEIEKMQYRNYTDDMLSFRIVDDIGHPLRTGIRYGRVLIVPMWYKLSDNPSQLQLQTLKERMKLIKSHFDDATDELCAHLRARQAAIAA